MVSITQIKEYKEFKECLQTIKDIEQDIDLLYDNKSIQIGNKDPYLIDLISFNIVILNYFGYDILKKVEVNQKYIEDKLGQYTPKIQKKLLQSITDFIVDVVNKYEPPVNIDLSVKINDLIPQFNKTHKPILDILKSEQFKEGDQYLEWAKMKLNSLTQDRQTHINVLNAIIRKIDEIDQQTEEIKQKCEEIEKQRNMVKKGLKDIQKQSIDILDTKLLNAGPRKDVQQCYNIVKSNPDSSNLIQFNNLVKDNRKTNKNISDTIITFIQETYQHIFPQWVNECQNIIDTVNNSFKYIDPLYLYKCEQLLTNDEGKYIITKQINNVTYIEDQRLTGNTIYVYTFNLKQLVKLNETLKLGYSYEQLELLCRNPLYIGETQQLGIIKDLRQITVRMLELMVESRGKSHNTDINKQHNKQVKKGKLTRESAMYQVIYQVFTLFIVDQEPNISEKTIKQHLLETLKCEDSRNTLKSVLTNTGYICLFEDEWNKIKLVDLQESDIADYVSNDVKQYVLDCIWYLFVKCETQYKENNILSIIEQKPILDLMTTSKFLIQRIESQMIGLMKPICNDKQLKHIQPDDEFFKYFDLNKDQSQVRQLIEVLPEFKFIKTPLTRYSIRTHRTQQERNLNIYIKD